MYNEEEVREDYKRLIDYLKTLESKYGDSFACVVALGVEIDDEAVAGSMFAMGEDQLFHQLLHMIVDRCPRFIDEFFDVVSCLTLKSHKDAPDFIKQMLVASVESMKKEVMKQSREFKRLKAEHDAKESVDKFLEDFYGRDKEN